MVNVQIINAMEIDNKFKDTIDISDYIMDIPLIKEMILNEKPVSSTQITLPSSFSWKKHNNKDWTTPAKHQGNCGSCWDFAAIGSLESIIKIRENRPEINPDLSEQYVLSC